MRYLIILLILASCADDDICNCEFVVYENNPETEFTTVEISREPSIECTEGYNTSFIVDYRREVWQVIERVECAY